MPYANILDKKTGNTFKALDFGGPAIYKVNGIWVYGWTGATSVTFDGKVATLNPYNKTSVLEDRWEVVSHQDIGTANWRVTVKNHSTQEVKTGVYPFNLKGNVYELKDCAPGTWVIASCGGYKIESSWSGKQNYELYRLKGTTEKIYTVTAIGGGPYLWYEAGWVSQPNNGVTTQSTIGRARIDMWYQNAKWVNGAFFATVSKPGIVYEEVLAEVLTAGNITHNSLFVLDHRYYGEQVWYFKLDLEAQPDYYSKSEYDSGGSGRIVVLPHKKSIRMPVVIDISIASMIIDSLYGD